MPRPFTTTARRFSALAVALLLLVIGVPMIAQTAGPEATGQVPYLTTNSTSTAFSLTAGRVTSLPSTAKSLGSLQNRWRGLEISAYGTGTAGTTWEYKLWTYKRSTSMVSGNYDDYTRQLYCYGVCTLGTGTGCSDDGAKTTDKLVCTMTVVLAASGTTYPGIGQMTVDTYGSAQPNVYSPGGSGEARLGIPDLGNAEWFEIETDLTGADSANYYYERGN